MTKEKLFDIPTDDRSFGEQMQDLGVEVKKPTSELKNLNWLNTRSKHGLPLNMLSVGKSYIRFGEVAIDLATEGDKNKKLQYAVAEYQGQKVLVVKAGLTGHKVSYSKNGNPLSGTPALSKAIKASGLPLGYYKVKKAKGGAICFPERS